MKTLQLLLPLVLPVAIAACTIQIAPPAAMPPNPGVEVGIQASAKPKPGTSATPDAADTLTADAYVKGYEVPPQVEPGAPFTLKVLYGLSDPSWSFDKLSVEVDEAAKTITVKPTMRKAAPRPDRPGMTVPAVIVDKSASTDVTITTPGSYTFVSPRYLSSPVSASIVVGKVEVGPLLTITSEGGLCPAGTCGSTVEIQSDGAYVVTAGQAEPSRGKLSAELLDALTSEVAKADFAAIKAVPFTGTCPTAFDGQEITYTFNTAKGPEKLPTCTYELDFESSLFQAVKRVRAAIDQPAGQN